MTTRKEFLKKFADMPLEKRNKVALNINHNNINQPVSWNVCWLEIQYNTELSKEILTKLN